MPTPGKSSSMRQIAVAAGVSVATVSHVINGSGRFSEDTRKRVEAAIEEYGYVTNMAAKSLRVAQSRTIGMIVPDISNDFFSKIALHVERELATEDYSVFVCNSANDPARERDYFRTLASKQADGIICISGLRRLDGEFVPHGIPVVCIERGLFSPEAVERCILPNKERYADRFRDFRLDNTKTAAAGIELGTLESDVERCLADFGW